MRTTIAVLVLLLASTAHGAVQTKGQQKCINSFNKGSAKLASAINKNSAKCIKDAGKGKVVDAQACVESDPNGSISKAQGSLSAKTAQSCTAEVPEFGYAGSAAAIMGVNDAGLALVEDIYGSDAQASIVLSAASKVDAGCQAEVIKVAGKAYDANWKAAVKAKKSSLKGQGAGPAASGPALEAAVSSAVSSDAKVLAAGSKINASLGKKCGGASSLATLFPGECATAGSVGEFANCVETATACRFCQALNETDGFAIDCDEFDNGASDGSCAAPAPEATIFVSSTTGNDANPGTQDEPKATILAGIAQAVSDGSSEVWVAAGTYAPAGEVILADGVNLTGGFDPVSWAADQGTTTIQGERQALLADSLTTPTTLSKLTINSGDASSGGSSYGIRVIDTTGFTIDSCVINAGQGFPGTAGSAGADGADGNPGGNGGSTTGDGPAGAGGSGGSGVGCGGGIISSNDGGSGGNGGPEGANGGFGGFSNWVGTALGGVGSDGVYCDFGGCSAGGGALGQPGVDGTDGTQGDGGGGVGTAGDFWSGSLGSSGTPGTFGEGGGGGGGGGGEGGLFIDDGGGAGGGGGGEGGCNGLGGGGGSPGQGSFGVYAFNSTLTLTSSTITSQDGGAGGSGGLGGSGGSGGFRGSGGSGGEGTGNGGNGGSGGDGGDGGRGGGGGGGASFAVYAASSTLTESGNTFTSGSGGSGGAPNGAQGASGLIGP